MSNPTSSEPSRPFLVFGHRGSPRVVRENTLASLQRAFDDGADGCEMDLRQLRDGRIVLFHDHLLGDRLIETFETEELRTALGDLTVAEELRQLRRRGTIVLEVKRGGWDDSLLEFTAGLENFVVSSFDHRLIRTLSQRSVSFDLGIIAFARLVDSADYIRSTGASWFFPHYSHVDRSLVEELHAASIRVMPWTVNRPGDWAEMRNLGCDGIITDIPGEAVAWRDRQ